MYSFMNDYSEGAHPRILQMMHTFNLEQNLGYGEDVHSQRAREYIRQLIGQPHADIHFIPGGTQTNLIAISAFLRPHQCVIAADTGHINVHETGAIEATGHKVVAMPNVEGKLTPAAIEAALEYHRDEHMVQPKMVYISNSTELGTIYSHAELAALHNLCRSHDLILYLDGARLGSALTCKTNDVGIEEIARLVDAFYIGGTKNGALLGEALVICREDLKTDFRYLIKQRGALMAKGVVTGIQFEALFQDNLFFDLAQHANRMAERIAGALRDCGYDFYAPPCTNQPFPILPKALLPKLAEQFLFSVQEEIDANHSAIRLVTSWATTEESVTALIDFLHTHQA
ncbi:MAG: aminotransferase class V-fold PLP-dependent enzyme [Firmicutes bacterium]|nr:aminotransferase class V-fold PLP-dependent enzyme [Bacillota bacterium]